MADLPADLATEVHRALVDLRAARLAATAWPAVAGDLARLSAAVDRGDVEGVRAALVPIGQATFEGKVRGRLAGAGRPAAMVVATKRTSALPVVGGLSALVLLVIGYLLGGWLVAAVTAAFAVFIFGVALAGTRTNRERADRRRASLAPSAEPTEPAPRLVLEAIERVDASLG